MGTRVRNARREEFLSDVVIGAVEGGTGYWAQVVEYRHSDGPARATLVDLDDDTESYHVTTDVVAHGIYVILSPVFQIGDTLRAMIRQASLEDDAGQLDAEACDVIVQAGLFGRIVYG